MLGLREPNALSDRFIGRAGYTAKPVSCRAKTADNQSHPLGGLVVDPTLAPQAFLPGSLPRANAAWQTKFLIGGRLPAGYTRVEAGPEKGLVRFHGRLIHADYDLMAVHPVSPGGNRFLTPAEAQALHEKVRPALNAGFGCDMIQHGAEMTYEGMGARPSEQILWFGPGHQFQQGTSSMPTQPGRMH